jgi:hypothetical protein
MIVTAFKEAKSESGHSDKKNFDNSILLPSCWTL